MYIVKVGFVYDTLRKEVFVVMMGLIGILVTAKTKYPSNMEINFMHNVALTCAGNNLC